MEIMLLTLPKNHFSNPILENRIISFRHCCSNNADRPQQQYLSGSSFLTDPNYLQNQGSRLDIILETETKEQPQPQPQPAYNFWKFSSKSKMCWSLFTSVLYHR